MNVYLILIICVAHFIADFVKQTDEMAKGKSKCNKALTEHISAYAMWFCITFWGLGFGLYFTGIDITNYTDGIGAEFGNAYLPLWINLWLLLNFMLHWITDYYTSRVSSRLWGEGRVHDFFVCIGFDQLLHISVWVMSYKTIGNFLTN